MAQRDPAAGVVADVAARRGGKQVRKQLVVLRRAGREHAAGVAHREVQRIRLHEAAQLERDLAHVLLYRGVGLDGPQQRVHAPGRVVHCTATPPECD